MVGPDDLRGLFQSMILWFYDSMILLFVSRQVLLKSLSQSFLQAPFKYWKGATRSPWNLLFYRLSKPQCPQPFLITDVFYPSSHFCGPTLDLLPQIYVFPVLRAPELDAGLQEGSHQSRGAESPPLTCWPWFSGCRQGYSWLSGLHTQLFIHEKIWEYFLILYENKCMNEWRK